MNIGELEEQIFSIKHQPVFEQLALAVFKYQYSQNLFYKKYVDLVQKDIESIKLLSDIPFLPIQFFKSQKIVAGDFEPQALFTSSGTTTTINSHHYIKDVSIYKKSFIKSFEQFYGNMDEYCILGLLPSYLERSGSSLVMMVDELIKLSGHAQSGFYLYDFEKLYHQLQDLEAKGQKTLLIGVTYALLDFAEQFPIPLKNTIVMETGGMKGRKAEIVRSEVHEILKTQFQTSFIHSEYGMTELLSQAYSSGNGRFFTPAWMKIILRKEDDPFDISDNFKGVINVVDLANIHSCSFIATDDLGSLYEDGSFEVLGRMDNADVRGCSLLYM